MAKPKSMAMDIMDKLVSIPPCPYCKRDNTIKHGTHKGVHLRYWCKNCKRKYTSRTKIWKEARELVVLCRKEEEPFTIIQKRIRHAFAPYNMPDSTLAQWLKPLHIVVKHRGKNSPSYFSVKFSINILEKKRIAKQIEYEHEYALAGNTGIYIIDELTKDIRNLDMRGEVRQQAALECLTIGLDRLDEDSIRGIIKRAVRAYWRVMGRHRDISLYTKYPNSERTLIDTIADPNAIDPIDLLCGV
jgi:hypothetical protein